MVTSKPSRRCRVDGVGAMIQRLRRRAARILIYAQIVTSACSALATAVAIACGTGGQNRVEAALPPVLCLSYASYRSMGSQTELRQSTI